MVAALRDDDVIRLAGVDQAVFLIDASAPET
jgi:hypothetical protein